MYTYTFETGPLYYQVFIRFDEKLSSLYQWKKVALMDVVLYDVKNNEVGQRVYQILKSVGIDDRLHLLGFQTHKQVVLNLGYEYKVLSSLIRIAGDFMRNHDPDIFIFSTVNHKSLFKKIIERYLPNSYVEVVEAFQYKIFYDYSIHLNKNDVKNLNLPPCVKEKSLTERVVSTLKSFRINKER